MIIGRGGAAPFVAGAVHGEAPMVLARTSKGQTAPSRRFAGTGGAGPGDVLA